MEISGWFPAGRDGLGAGGAFSQTSRLDSYGGGKYDLGMFDFYASRSWTGETSSNGGHSHTITLSSKFLNKSDTVQPPSVSVYAKTRYC